MKIFDDSLSQLRCALILLNFFFNIMKLDSIFIYLVHVWHYFYPIAYVDAGV